MKVRVKHITFVCLLPVALALAAVVLLYVPAVQNFIARKVADYASEETGMKVEVGNVRLRFPLKLSVSNALIMQPQSYDTLAFIRQMTADVRLRPLFHGILSVKSLAIKDMYVDTGELIDGFGIKGFVGDAFAIADSIGLNSDNTLINSLKLNDADFDIYLCDTTAVADTTKSDFNRRFALNSIEIGNVGLTLRMPCDSFRLDLKEGKVEVDEGFAQAYDGVFGAKTVLIMLKNVNANADFGVTDLILQLDSLRFGGIKDASVIIREFKAKDEATGLEIKSLTGTVTADSIGIGIPIMAVATEHSTCELVANVPFSAFSETNPTGQASVKITATVDPKDVTTITGATKLPDKPLKISADATGNRNDVMMRKCAVSMPETFELNINGNIKEPLNQQLITGDIFLDATTGNIDFLAQMMPKDMQNRFEIPDSMNLAGKASINKGSYSTELLLTERRGNLSLIADYNPQSNDYEAVIKLQNFDVIDFMPQDSISNINGFIRIKGKGTDIYSNKTFAEITSEIDDITYCKSDINNIDFHASLDNNHLLATLTSAYAPAKGTIEIDADISKELIQGRITAEVDSLNFNTLGFIDTPTGSSFNIATNFSTDLDKLYNLDLRLSQWMLNIEQQIFTPRPVFLTVNSASSNSDVNFHVGDMTLSITGKSDMFTIADKFMLLTDSVLTQFKVDSTIHFSALRNYFPDISLKFNALHNNPLYNYLLESGIFFDRLDFEAAISPENGLTVNGLVTSLVSDTLKIDTIKLQTSQDAEGLLYNINVIKKRFRNQDAFLASVNGYLHDNEADIFINHINSRGEHGMKLGTKIRKAPQGVDFQLYPENPVIAFLPFKVDENNYIKYINIKHIEADLRLDGQSNSSIWLHSDENNTELMAEISRIDLAKVSEGFTSLPSMKGMLNASLRYQPSEQSFMILGDCNIDNLYYQDGQLGEILLNASYMPLKSDEHQVDMHVFHNNREISSLSILYTSGLNADHLNGYIDLNDIPLKLLNPFLPIGIAKLDGLMSGKMTVAGSSQKPDIDGFIQIKDGTLLAIPTATYFRLEDKQIKVNDNTVIFDKFKINAAKINPFIIDGKISDIIDNPIFNLQMTANNFQPLEANRKPESLAFGKLFMNMNATLKGDFDAMKINGNIHVLGSTNMTYVMPSSQLEVQDNLNGLVTFTYFADTLPRRQRTALGFNQLARNVAVSGGGNITMNIKIDPVVRLRIDFDKESSNHTEMRGGGNLILRYDNQGNMTLNGRYSVSEGTVRYAIPIIPLTDFTIRNGSYLDWTGNPMNPYINLSAYTHVRSSVDFDGQSRMVDFNSGIQVKDNLDDMTVVFLLEAPNDAVVQNQLVAMGSEERSKQAISLLVAGIYLAGSGTGSENVNVGAAINTLLQREIKNILGNVIGDVPFSFDVNTYDGTLGMGRRVDYLGRFHTTFLNDRLKTELGVRYSTKDPVFGDRFFWDNISLEYRLDNDGARSMSIFRTKEYESLFEGEISKTGVGFKFHRNLKRLRPFKISPLQ
ncbi:MAG: translocation/assembly module TamB [Tannerella sp.]|jgi:hypothetical protein|nr:translocation/assembly module TamB [Tannerella sp.]